MKQILDWENDDLSEGGATRCAFKSGYKLGLVV